MDEQTRAEKLLVLQHEGNWRASFRQAFKLIVLAMANLAILVPTDSFGADDSPAQRAARRLPLAICSAYWGDEEILCGQYEVYENRTVASGRKIALNIVVIPALAENPEPDPLFYLEGGPGVAATDAGELFAVILPFRKSRDIVLIDQRGTGSSNPLHCNLVGDSSNLQNFLNEMYPVDLVKSCREELEKWADLTQYTTPIAMEDLDEVRQWLGYDRINITGLSYGGRAAYVYARAHPDHVRAMILTGPADLQSKLPLHHAEEAERGLAMLCMDCRADSACNAAFPGLEQELRALVERLRVQPAKTTYPHPLTGKVTPVTIRADVFVEAMRTALYAPASSRSVPWIVHRAHEGDLVPFLDGVIHIDTLPPFLADGMYLSVTGTEDAPYFSAAEADSLARGSLLGNYRVFQQRRAAEHWPRGVLPSGYFDDVICDIPTLIVLGERDPVVSQANMLRRVRRGREIRIPQMAHVPFGLSNLDCLFNLMATFLETTDPLGLDAECVDKMSSPPFEVGSDASK